ncbi:MAG: 50S ribosomal protein L4 [Halobacteriovoraceae bacterium]|nr:50S ribosomal protein L4 [Halobacteriovoraceae bacterium]|tara:strand:- start:6391 stop:7008 length:618 start_codon:yes stop_codon:yes gene_type:complete
MADINVLNNKFEKSGSLSTDVNLDAEVISAPSVHQVVKATLASRRQGNACTKNRAKVRGGGAKPFKQKGTGRARQGSSRSPLMVGGGVVFGPTPRDYTQSVNKKMMKKAIQSILADKYQAGKLFVVETLESNGKTKDMFKTLSERNLLPGLVVTESRDSMAIRATKNIRNAKSMAVEGFSVYEAVKFENLIIEKAALEKLLGKLG